MSETGEAFNCSTAAGRGREECTRTVFTPNGRDAECELRGALEFQRRRAVVFHQVGLRGGGDRAEEGEGDGRVGGQAPRLDQPQNQPAAVPLGGLQGGADNVRRIDGQQAGGGRQQPCLFPRTGTASSGQWAAQPNSSALPDRQSPWWLRRE